jgi:hypothetical protein
VHEGVFGQTLPGIVSHMLGETEVVALQCFASETEIAGEAKDNMFRTGSSSLS